MPIRALQNHHPIGLLANRNTRLASGPGTRNPRRDSGALHGRFKCQATIERGCENADEAVSRRSCVHDVDGHGGDADFFALEAGFGTITTESAQDPGVQPARNLGCRRAAVQPIRQSSRFVFIDDQ